MWQLVNAWPKGEFLATLSQRLRLTCRKIDARADHQFLDSRVSRSIDGPMSSSSGPRLSRKSWSKSLAFRICPFGISCLIHMPFTDSSSAPNKDKLVSGEGPKFARSKAPNPIRSSAVCQEPRWLIGAESTRKLGILRAGGHEYGWAAGSLTSDTVRLRQNEWGGNMALN